MLTILTRGSVSAFHFCRHMNTCSIITQFASPIRPMLFSETRSLLKFLFLLLYWLALPLSTLSFQCDITDSAWNRIPRDGNRWNSLSNAASTLRNRTIRVVAANTLHPHFDAGIPIIAARTSSSFAIATKGFIRVNTPHFIPTIRHSLLNTDTFCVIVGERLIQQECHD